MKTKTLLMLSSLLFFMNCSYSQQKSATPKSSGKMSNNVSVVELFTSEGCSSCPSADALMPKLKEAYGDRLIVLAFHVDYWNRLGWKDVFSSADYTRRQNLYAAALRTDNIYTPQAVVNGRAHITGSHRSGLQALINGNALAPDAAQPIDLSAKSDGNATIAVTYSVPLKKGEVLNIALTQQHATTNVKRGENGGRRLEHYSVVRDFRTLSEGVGTTRLTIPDGLMPDAFNVAAFTQRLSDMHITGAAEANVE